MNKIFLIILLLGSLTFAQLSVDLTIENQQAVGTEFFFDIYLRSSQASDSIFLGSSDFVLSFNQGNFSSPELTLEGDPFGEAFCTFVPRVAAQTSGTRTLYTGVIATEIINGNRLVINTNGPNASTQSFFNNRIARIDNTPSTHRLGRFKVSGITNPSGFMNLQWVTVSTLVGSIDPITRDENQIVVNTIDPTNQPLPVELTSFTATTRNDAVTLNWKTATEINNYGFEVERTASPNPSQGGEQSNFQWNKIGFVSGSGNSNSIKEYSFKDNNLYGGGSNFLYRLKQIDNDGSFEYSDIVEVEVVPQEFELSQNYPNPFNPTTAIRFSLPVQAQLKINIYNMLGELVKTISEGMYEAGFYSISFDASELSSGTYIYRLESKDFVETKKMLMIK